MSKFTPYRGPDIRMVHHFRPWLFRSQDLIHFSVGLQSGFLAGMSSLTAG